MAEENPTDPNLLAQASMLFKIKEEKDKQDGSIIIVLATDAPLHPTQLKRLAKLTYPYHDQSLTVLQS